MSKPRYNWWPFALNMIRDYPTRVQEYRDMHEQKITADLSGMPGGGGDVRKAEKIALRQFPAQEQREFDTVRLAVERTRRMTSARDRLQIVKLTLWSNSYTLAGAADVLHISERTARRYRSQFIILVGYLYGFLEEEEYREAVRKDSGNKKRTPRAKES